MSSCQECRRRAQRPCAEPLRIREEEPVDQAELLPMTPQHHASGPLPVCKIATASPWLAGCPRLSTLAAFPLLSS